VEVPPDPIQWVAVQAATRKRELNDVLLVLQAVGIPHGVLQRDGAHHVLVPSDRSAEALQQLENYRGENRHWPPRGETASGSLAEGALGALVWTALLSVFGWQQYVHAFGFDWAQKGMLASDLLRDEPWRAATSLTLHGDLGHWASNAAYGCLFLLLFAELVGSGLAVSLTLLAGTLGNVINGLVRTGSFYALGASTAVFAALGALIAYQARQRGREKLGAFRRWAPILGGISLLGFLGGFGEYVPQSEAMAERMRQFEGPPTDVGGHVLGFLCGALLGLALGGIPSRTLLAWRAQPFLLAAAPLAIGALWLAALL
jgi:membrane associated rhomboid family serine protease